MVRGELTDRNHPMMAESVAAKRFQAQCVANKCAKMGVTKAVRRGSNPAPDLAATPHWEGALALAERTAATSVYRYYDRHDLLIYVGITSRGRFRNREHDASAAWWPYVARQEVDHYETRTEAQEVERALIRCFRPPFNRQHNPESAVMRDVYVAWFNSDETSEDALALYVALRHRLRFMPIGTSDGFLILRSVPDEAPVARRMVWPEHRKPTVLNRVASAKRIEVTGPFALLYLRLKEDVTIKAADVEVRLRQNKPPFVFWLRSVRPYYFKRDA